MAKKKKKGASGAATPALAMLRAAGIEHQVHEFDAGHAERAVHIPLGEVPMRLSEVPDADRLYVICKSGGRSSRAVAFLRERGIDACNVEGGTTAWHAAGKPMTAEHDGEPVVL